MVNIPSAHILLLFAYISFGLVSLVGWLIVWSPSNPKRHSIVIEEPTISLSIAFMHTFIQGKMQRDESAPRVCCYNIEMKYICNDRQV